MAEWLHNIYEWQTRTIAITNNYHEDKDIEMNRTTSANTISSSLKKFSLRRSYSAAVYN